MRIEQIYKKLGKDIPYSWNAMDRFREIKLDLDPNTTDAVLRALSSYHDWYKTFDRGIARLIKRGLLTETVDVNPFVRQGQGQYYTHAGSLWIGKKGLIRSNPPKPLQNKALDKYENRVYSRIKSILNETFQSPKFYFEDFKIVPKSEVQITAPSTYFRQLSIHSVPTFLNYSTKDILATDVKTDEMTEDEIEVGKVKGWLTKDIRQIKNGETAPMTTLWYAKTNEFMSTGKNRSSVIAGVRTKCVNATSKKLKTEKTIEW